MTQTSHGHHIPGTPINDEDRRMAVARCGGIGICSVCIHDSSRVQRHPILVREMFDQGTMGKVFDALVGSGLSRDQALDAMTGMQKAGILFREQWMYEISPKCTRCTESNRIYPHLMHETAEHDAWWIQQVNANS